MEKVSGHVPDTQQFMTELEKVAQHVSDTQQFMTGQTQAKMQLNSAVVPAPPAGFVASPRRLSVF